MLFSNLINTISSATASHRSSFATCFEMVNISKVHREIKTVPPGWRFEVGEKMIYDLHLPSVESVFKGTIKCNQVVVNSQHFVWPSHLHYNDGSCTEHNSPLIHVKSASRFSLLSVCFRLLHSGFLHILEGVSYHGELSQLSHRDKKLLQSRFTQTNVSLAFTVTLVL